MHVMYVCNQCGKPGKLNSEGVCESCVRTPIWGENAVFIEKSAENLRERDQRVKEHLRKEKHKRIAIKVMVILLFMAAIAYFGIKFLF